MHASLDLLFVSINFSSSPRRQLKPHTNSPPRPLKPHTSSPRRQLKPHTSSPRRQLKPHTSSPRRQLKPHTSSPRRQLKPHTNSPPRPLKPHLFVGFIDNLVEAFVSLIFQRFREVLVEFGILRLLHSHHQHRFVGLLCQLVSLIRIIRSIPILR